MKTQTYIRIFELMFSLTSTYMGAVTLIQTSAWEKLTPYILKYIGPLLIGFGLDPAYFDLSLIGLFMALSFSFWRRGDEAGFGRLFSLNMLLFFPAVLDFSTFNWINLILSYDPEPIISAIWVFSVGLLLQATYLALRYAVRIREIRTELLSRGAEMGDVDQISKGQMTYLGQLVLGTTVFSVFIYFLAPMMQRLVKLESYNIPYPHIVTGLLCTLMIAAAIILYLKGWGKKPEI